MKSSRGSWTRSAPVDYEPTATARKLILIMPRPAPYPQRGEDRSGRSLRDVNRRTLSQNFLRGSSAVERYLSVVDVEPDEIVIEVGAGDGAITEAVAPRCREVVAYEIDPFHAKKLASRIRGQENVQVVVGDFLASTAPCSRFAVVGNVPFAITSKVVDWCLAARMLSTATIITQLEYAKKRTGGYGRWSLRTIETWPWFSWELLGQIPRHEFRPVPRVDAGILRLVQRDQPLLSAAKFRAYSRMVEIGFGGVGGSLHKSLLRSYPANRVETGFREAGVPRDTVVAFVTPEEWLSIFTSLDR